MEPFDHFLAYVVKADRLQRESVGTAEFEQEFVVVLDFIKAHPELRPKIITHFTATLQDKSFGPYTLIEFCMHELRWPEFRNQVEKIYTASKEKAVQNKLYGTPSQHLFYLEAVLSSFDDSWPDADLFAYYA